MPPSNVKPDSAKSQAGQVKAQNAQHHRPWRIDQTGKPAEWSFQAWSYQRDYSLPENIKGGGGGSFEETLTKGILGLEVQHENYIFNAWKYSQIHVQELHRSTIADPWLGEIIKLQLLLKFIEIVQMAGIAERSSRRSMVVSAWKLHCKMDQTRQRQLKDSADERGKKRRQHHQQCRPTREPTSRARANCAQVSFW